MKHTSDSEANSDVGCHNRTTSHLHACSDCRTQLYLSFVKESPTSTLLLFPRLHESIWRPLRQHSFTLGRHHATAVANAKGRWAPDSRGFATASGVTLPPKLPSSRASAARPGTHPPLHRYPRRAVAPGSAAPQARSAGVDDDEGEVAFADAPPRR